MAGEAAFVKAVKAAVAHVASALKQIWTALRKLVIQLHAWFERLGPTIKYLAALRRQRMRNVHITYRAKHRYPQRR